MERRAFLVYGLALAAEATLSAACGAPASLTARATPTVSSSESAQEKWAKLPAKSRILRLERLEHPAFPGFDPQQELNLSVAEHFCIKGICTLSP